jgi:hypothetical protein
MYLYLIVLIIQCDIAESFCAPVYDANSKK